MDWHFKVLDMYFKEKSDPKSMLGNIPLTSGTEEKNGGNKSPSINAICKGLGWLYLEYSVDQCHHK